MPTVEFLHHALLAAGGAALSVPLLLHLLTRRQPRPMLFPALRFLQQRQKRTQRQLRWRHWLLLLLRCLILGLLAVLLARPRVSSNSAGLVVLAAMLALLSVAVGLTAALLVAGDRRMQRWLTGAAVACVAAGCVVWWGLGSQGSLWRDQEEPVAAVLVFDTTPRMQYMHANHTRLEVAQQFATQLLQQFPPGSEIGIVDGGGPVGILTSERLAVQRKVQSLQTTFMPTPMRASIQAALDLLRSATHQAHEIYLFSDLAADVWQAEQGEEWRTLLARLDQVSVQVLDVGVEPHQNVGIVAVRVIPENGVAGQTVQIEAQLHREGDEGAVEVDLLLEEFAPELPIVLDGSVKLPALQPRERKRVPFGTDQSALLRFELSNLEPGVHHGLVQIRDHRDGLSIDDRRFFSFRVRPMRSVLLTSWDAAMRDTIRHLLGPAGFQVSVCEPAELADSDFSTYDVLCWLDPPPLPRREWERAIQFVTQGGGMCISLGPQARPPAEFASPRALELLAAAPLRIWNAADEPLSLQLTDYDHPALRPLAPYRSAIDWSPFRIYRYWDLGPLAPGSQVLAVFGAGKPAIVNRAVGAGQVTTVTTPLGQSLRDDQPWNWLLSQTDAWPPFALCVELFQFLSDPPASHWNFEVGESPQIAWKNAPPGAVYQLFTPANSWQPITAEESGVVRVPYADRPGIYRLKAPELNLPMAGISVNLAPQAVSLTPLSTPTIQEQLGVSDWQFSRRTDELRREVRLRGSFEVYAPILILLAVILACEHITANRFYAAKTEPPGLFPAESQGA